MIKTKKELREYIKQDSIYFNSFSKNVRTVDKLSNSNQFFILKFLKLLRKEEYYFNNKKNLFSLIMYLITRKKRHNLARKLGFNVEINSIGPGVKFEHFGSVVINGNAVIGSNCRFRGNNCVGVSTSGGSPIIGNNVDFGFGSIVIGDVTIADDVKIGAGAVVTKSCLVKGAILVGVPARILLKESE